MFKNYLLSAWQNLVRQKLFAVINIFGLSIGLAVFILIFLYVEKEYSWDQHWEDADRIHWMTMERSLNSTNRNTSPAVPAAIHGLLQENFSEEIEKSARLVFRNGQVSIEGQEYQGGIMLADPGFIDIFALDVLRGNLEETFSGPGRIALNKSTAEMYFGEEDPIGKTISFTPTGQEIEDYRVTAVYTRPAESSLIAASLTLMDDSLIPEGASYAQSWWNTAFGIIYLLLSPEADIEAMDRRMVELVDTVIPTEPFRILQPDEKFSDFVSFQFEKLIDAHFTAEFLGNTTVDENKVRIFALIGVLVLIMGSTNFVILATAKAEDRRREVGVRKVLGAQKSQLVIQFLSESVLQTFMALLLAIGLVLISLPVFGNLIGRELSLTLISYETVLMLIVLAVAVGVLGGLYPALVLSGFSPVSIFRPGGKTFLPGLFNLRNVLACFQFMIAISLIIATLVIYFQLNYIRNVDPGFSSENLFSIGVGFQERERIMNPLLNELEAIAGVELITASTRRPGPGGVTIRVSANYRFRDSEADATGIWVDYNFFDVFGIKLLAGRVFDPRFDQVFDRNTPAEERDAPKLVINRKYAESLGFTNPEEAVGQFLISEFRTPEGETGRTQIEIIGVVEDSRFESLRELPENTVYQMTANNMTTVTLRYSDAVQASIRSDVESIWNRVAPNNPFQGEFVSTVLADEFLQEENEGKLLFAFAVLSMIIASMGLFGLASYAVRKGIKEVGIRKVLGANFKGIVMLFLLRFSLPVLAANLVAWPVAVYAMLRWLQRFPEQIGYDRILPVCLLATMVALLLAWLTVGTTTTRAARANPVHSLRYE